MHRAPPSRVPPPIALLGSPCALARSMAHALQQAWQRHQPDTGWQCLAPGPGEPLPQAMALYLLGLDWQTWQAGPGPADGSAETGAAAQHALWRERLQAERRDYVVLYGSPARQWQQLAESLRACAPETDWSWLPAGQSRPGGRLRPMGCEQCSDPDCERRLFDALLRERP